MRVAAAGDPQTLDPRYARDLYSVHHVHLLYEGLFRKGVNGETIPALCSSYQVFNDGQSYRFHLIKAVWSNGDPITATDFVRSWTSVMNSKDAPFAYQLLGIKKLQVESPSSFLVELHSPDSNFIEQLTTNSFFPVHENLEVYCGPFKLKEWDHHHSIVLEKNLNYRHKDQINVKELIFEKVHDETALRLFEKGKLDWIGSPLGNIPLDSLDFLKTKPISNPSASTRFLRVNVDNVPLDLRKALNTHIDREEIVRLISKGEENIAYGFVPDLFGLEVESPKSESDFEPLKRPLILVYIQHEGNHRISQLLEHQWKKDLNVKVTLKPCSPKIFYERLQNRDYDLAMGTWYAGTWDPLTFLEVLKYQNDTGWVNEHYQSLCNQATCEVDPLIRKKLMADAQKILVDELPIIPLYYPSFRHLVKEPFSEIKVTPLGFLDFHDAKILQ